MFKRIILIVAVLLFAIGLAFAQDEEEADVISITTKQGFLRTWEEGEVEHLTTFETIRTKKIESWGKWNMFWAGWSLDAGFAYDNSDVLSTGALMIGRNFGTLGDYLPIEFPLAKYITITLYPIGLYIRNLTDSPEVEYASGLGFIKAEIRF